jgi:glycosyltransferase involved in cell wall biosynthesis
MDTQSIKEKIKQSKLAWVIEYAKKLRGLKDSIFDLKDRLKTKQWPENSIVYFTGHTMYEWSPDSLKTGIGGSETAVINLAREWIKLGYFVTVYGNFGNNAGTYDGVDYRHYTEFNKYDTFDTLVIWRRVDYINVTYKANRVWYDVHDVLYNHQFNQQNLSNIDTIFFKSNYQRSLLPQATEDKFVIIPNGIDRSLLDLDLTHKDPNKLVYASNYQRGLELMLVYGWPIVKREIPDAVLHIYYGWEFTDLMYGEKPDYQTWKAKMLELMQQPGIVEHGRVGQATLIAEKANAVMNYYATNFEEMEPISLKESAIVRCLPVTTNYAALAEKDYCLKLEGDPNDQQTQEAVAYKVVELLKNPALLEDLSHQSRQTAQSETWDNIAKRWIEQIKK